MATHSSVLAWRIPGMGEPGGLPSMGSHKVGHDCSDLAALSSSSEFFISVIILFSPGGLDGKESACDAEELSWEGLLEKEMATHSSILAWRILWTEEPSGLHIVCGVSKSWT